MKANEPLITFELGDVVRCPYYNYTGIIIDIKPSENPDIIPFYITIHDPNKPIEHKCVTKLRTIAGSRTYPLYLQLVCKKEDYENISKNTIFK